MAGHDEDRERELRDDLTAAYAVMSKVLQRLPIPLALPLESGAELTGADLEDALTRAIALVGEVPMDQDAKPMLDEMILDWLTAFTLYRFELLRPTGWRLDAAENAILRIMTLADLVEPYLDPDPGRD